MDQRERREKLEKLTDLGEIYIQVMYYRFLDKNVSQIKEILEISNEKTVWTRFTRIYEKLGITGEDKEGELIREYSPIFLEFVKNEEDLNNWGYVRAEMYRQLEELRTKFEATVKTPDVSQSEPSSHKAQDIEDSPESAPKTSESHDTQSQQTVRSSERQPPARPSWILIATSALVLCLLCISGGLFGWRFFQPIIQNALTPDQPVQSTQPESTILVDDPATDSPTSTFTALATETIQPTATLVITDTPFPTPSATQPSYYSEKMAAELKTGVFLAINPDFGNPNYVLCIAPRPGFSIKFNLTNNSSDEFLMRFNWYEFSVVDDQGNEFEVNGAGVNGCPSDPGLRTLAIGSNSAVRIFVSFAGQIGIDARYLLVTVENISGYGPFVFRKDF